MTAAISGAFSQVCTHAGNAASAVVHAAKNLASNAGPYAAKAGQWGRHTVEQIATHAGHVWSKVSTTMAPHFARVVEFSKQNKVGLALGAAVAVLLVGTYALVQKTFCKAAAPVAAPAPAAAPVAAPVLAAV